MSIKENTTKNYSNKRISLTFGKQCNMHCPFCYEYFDREKLELPKIFRIIEVCKQNRFQRISVAGGDPLGYSNIESVLEYAEELNLEVDLDTNCLAYNSG